VNLAAHIESGTVAIIDAEQESRMSASAVGDLKSIFERVRAALQDIADEDERPLLILDDVALLEWTGSSSVDVSRLVRSLRSLCLRVRIPNGTTFPLILFFAETRNVYSEAPSRHANRARGAISPHFADLLVPSRSETTRKWAER